MRFWSLTGVSNYDSVRMLQLKLLELRAANRIEDTVLFLEHEAVITRGRGLQFTGEARPRHMPVMALPIPLVESERGGDLTYHGPGQLVIYPILKLDGEGFSPKHDIGRFLRKFEGVLIEILADLGLKSESRENAAGVWVGPSKVASIGIAIKKWVVYHGMAVNCVNDLKPFSLFSPCGFSPEVMTKLSDLVPGYDQTNWRDDLEKRFTRKMSSASAPIRKLSCSEAFAEAMHEDPGLNLA